MELKIMTYNIHHGKGMDKQIDLHRTAKVIEKSDADIISLNEVDKHYSERSDYLDQSMWLAQQLNMYHAFSPSLTLTSKQTTTKRQYGNALLSRFPIVSEKSYLFNFIPGLIEGRSLLTATVEHNKKLFDINVTHLSLNPILHRKQINFIVNQLHKNSHPMIIMGDWNMKPGSRGWRKMTTEFHDVWDHAGNGTGFTYPSLRPKLRLDYLFVSPSFQVVDAEVISNLPHASDHLPLKATLLFSQ
ncbi:endonuclease/exonuclease/phosphatase family protein [Bacillus canaveralius]|uniref:endonuclease/exonuclease/phosphatase family protein n=1 Tax=Bacillus canaveralius TaxID=1403243 RepID=UPI0021AD5EE4|nr:endonuclease/exonuclease/phosphatase family protein [Bacillus canaveralius]